MTWMLVFWLQTPGNFAEHNQFKSEAECKSEQQAWQYRMDKVKSQLVADCRIKPLVAIKDNK